MLVMPMIDPAFRSAPAAERKAPRVCHGLPTKPPRHHRGFFGISWSPHARRKYLLRSSQRDGQQLAKSKMANAAPLASNYFYAPGLFRSRKYWSCHLCSDKILQFRSHCLESCNGGRNPTSPVRPSTQPLPPTQLSPAMPAAAAALPTTAVKFSVLLKPRTWNIAKRGCVALPMPKWPI